MNNDEPKWYQCVPVVVVLPFLAIMAVQAISLICQAAITIAATKAGSTLPGVPK